MSKCYFLVLFSLFVFSTKAQLNLTKAFNEPVIGDVNTNADFDTLSTLPNTIGTNQWWDFSSLISKSSVGNSIYSNASSTPHGSNFPTATMANYDGTNTYSYYKITPTQMEIAGLDSPDIVLNYTNTAIAAIWPISMGYKITDAFAGNASSGTMTGGTSNGTITVWATGTGTLTVPGGTVFDSVLQLRTSLRTNASFLFGFVTATLNAVQYDYYHASQKFPIVSITYSNIYGDFTRNSVSVKINNNVMMVGLPEDNYTNTFIMYPNPAKETFNVKLTNRANAFVKLEIMNVMGVMVKSQDLGNSPEITETISIADLPAGLYIIKTSAGENISIRKVIVE